MTTHRPTTRRAVAALTVVAALVASPAATAVTGEPVSDPAARTAPAGADAAARLAVAELARATAVNDTDANGLFDDLDAAYAADAGRQPVLVSFQDGVATADGLRAVTDVAPRAPVARPFTIVPAYAGALDAAEAARVAALPQVRQVELDRPGRRELDTATTVFGAAAVVDDWGVTGSLDNQEGVATTGDVAVAVLDTGIDAGHRDLAGKLVAWHDLGTGRKTPHDPNGHGTHVASIAAGWGHDDVRYRGVAPGAALVGIKIDGGGSTSSNAIAAYEWVVEHKDALGIRVATMSFGFGTATDGTTALERAVDAAWDAGVVCFKSNGNSGPGPSTMTVPAAARGILAVGSMLDPAGAGTKYGMALSQFSSRGPTTDGRVKPDLVAPGESITAARAGTSAGYTAMSGTSMASPFAAGAAALLLATDPTLTPDGVRDLLLRTTQDWGVQGPDNDYGHGRLQVWQAVAAARAATGQSVGGSAPPVVPRHQAVTSTAGTGTVEMAFDVADTAFPVAVTAHGSVLVGSIEVRDPAGTLLVPVGVANLADRHHLLSFRPTRTGTYTVRITAPPTTSVTVDVSHSTAEPG